MPIRERIRQWLGITDIRVDISMLDNRLMSLHRKIDKNSLQISAIAPGLSRVIVKLDARFAEDESNASPERKAESERLAKDTIKRLEAEAKARAPYNLTSDDDYA